MDFLGARLHGRRSRLAEGRRLETLCGLRDIAELGRAVYPETQFKEAPEFQRRAAQDSVGELASLVSWVGGAGAALLTWFLARFQIENLKILLRAFLNREPAEVLEAHLLALPPGLALDAENLLAAGSLDEFAGLLPPGMPRQSLRQALRVYGRQPRPFFLEAALDRGYLHELLARGRQLSGEDRQLIQPILFEEADAFHLMLAVRGRFHYDLASDLLLPLHVRSSGISQERFEAMLAAPDVIAAARLSLGRAIDALPVDRGSGSASAAAEASTLEALVWKRYLRLANRAFRSSHMGLAAVVGYVGIRRAELANLITLSEGIATSTPAEALRARMIPRTDLEGGYV